MKNKKLLTTHWTHPDCSQTFIIPGNKQDTFADAVGTMTGNSGLMDVQLFKGVEKQMTDKELKSLPEYEG